MIELTIPQIIANCFLISIWNIALMKMKDTDMILSPIQRFYMKQDPGTVLDIVLKPIIGCVYCMSSVWGSILFVAVNGITNDFTAFLWVEWILCCVCSVATTWFLMNFFKLDAGNGD